jgi:hypothetical protein
MTIRGNFLLLIFLNFILLRFLLPMIRICVCPKSAVGFAIGQPNRIASGVTHSPSLSIDEVFAALHSWNWPNKHASSE